jgi:hypothetical protein
MTGIRRCSAQGSVKAQKPIIKGLMLPITDQPGYTRAVLCSMGAYELEPTSSPSYPIALPLLKR